MKGDEGESWPMLLSSSIERPGLKRRMLLLREASRFASSAKASGRVVRPRPMRPSQLSAK